MGEIQELKIVTLGRQGDGIANDGEKDIYIPLTLPDETVKADIEGDRGQLLSVLSPSPERIEPICKHYQTCGGCSLQHMSQDSYLQWKQNIVRQAFAKCGMDIEPESVRTVPLHSRRRAVMEIRRTKKTTQLGFHGRRSNDIVDIGECPILDLAILKQLPNLKTLLRPLLSRKATSRLYITSTLNGLDISIDSVNKDLNAEIREQIAHHAREFGIVRLTVNEDTIFIQAPPVLKFTDVTVEISPGSFLQAVAEAETQMTEIILNAVGNAGKVVDLFSGTGTFTFPLAKKAEVTAIEYDKNALQQLRHGYENAQGLKPIKTELRDLVREPLSAKELGAYNAAVFDPPRAGARAQAETLSESAVQTIVAVSCNPSTLARDVRILLNGGYNLERVVPVDQFLYSAHIEAVAVLKR